MCNKIYNKEINKNILNINNRGRGKHLRCHQIPLHAIPSGATADEEQVTSRLPGQETDEVDRTRHWTRDEETCDRVI